VDSDLTKLRRARSRCHFALKQAEALAQTYRDKLADLEARIQAIAPDLQLPVRFRRPNPHFARGELTRLALDMLREAGRPMSIGEMAIAALAAKGVRFPDRRIRRITRTRLRGALNRFEARGLVRSVGTGNRTRRELI
jgi:hypothetical protein